MYWKIVEGKVINNADGVLFTSDEEYHLAQRTFSPYGPKKEFIIGLGVAEPPPYTPSFAQSCPKLMDDTFILYLSRVHEKKGVDLLIKAYAEIVGKIRQNTSVEQLPGETEGKVLFRREFPKLVIAGPGLETSYGQKIQDIVLASPGLKNNVFFPGMLTGDAKWGAFYRCEAFVLPSHQENFGIAVVEALSCSKPVLISKKVNIWREIASSGGGMTADDTYAGTKSLLTNWFNASNEAKQAMEQNARACYEKHFAVGPAAVKLLEAINSEKVQVV